MNQIMPKIEYSDAEVVILGGDFNDHPLSGKKKDQGIKETGMSDKRSDIGDGASGY